MSKDVSRNEFVFDNRIASRNIRDGRLDRTEYETRIASLPDLADQCEDIGEEIFGSTKKHGLALTGDFTSNEQDEV